MSGIKPPEMQEFYARLRARGVTTDSLAAEIGVSGGVVRRLIGNLRPRRGLTWRAILDQLEPEERELLLRVEQCATWNIRQLAKRPKFTPEKAAAIAAAQQRAAGSEVAA